MWLQARKYAILFSLACQLRAAVKYRLTINVSKSSNRGLRNLTLSYKRTTCSSVKWGRTRAVSSTVTLSLRQCGGQDFATPVDSRQFIMFLPAVTTLKEYWIKFNLLLYLGNLIPYLPLNDRWTTSTKPEQTLDAAETLSCCSPTAVSQRTRGWHDTKCSKKSSLACFYWRVRKNLLKYYKQK